MFLHPVTGLLRTRSPAPSPRRSLTDAWPRVMYVGEAAGEDVVLDLDPDKLK